jgi:hypothetical protein
MFWHDNLSYWMPDSKSHYAGVADGTPPP